MKKLLLLLSLFGLLLAAMPAEAQKHHRIGRANKSLSVKGEHSNPKVRHREKKKIEKKKTDKGLKRRQRKDRKQNEKKREGQETSPGQKSEEEQPAN